MKTTKNDPKIIDCLSRSFVDVLLAVDDHIRHHVSPRLWAEHVNVIYNQLNIGFILFASAILSSYVIIRFAFYDQLSMFERNQHISLVEDTCN